MQWLRHGTAPDNKHHLLLLTVQSPVCQIWNHKHDRYSFSFLPHLLITAARKNEVKEDIVILTATSGDTGKAALAGFADVEGTKIIVFYPKNGVSPIQEKQMITERCKYLCGWNPRKL